MISDKFMDLTGSIALAIMFLVFVYAWATLIYLLARGIGFEIVQWTSLGIIFALTCYNTYRIRKLERPKNEGKE